MTESDAFPGDRVRRTSGDGDGAGPRPDGVPEPVWRAVRSVRAMRRVPGVRYREIAVPGTWAPWGIGVGLERGRGARTADGWILLGYRPGAAPGDRPWRAVAYARLPLDGGEDDAPGTCWGRMADCLRSVRPDGLGGTVTVLHDTSFGELDRQPRTVWEVRASWAPSAPSGTLDAGAQTEAWARFLGSIACEESDAIA